MDLSTVLGKYIYIYLSLDMIWQKVLFIVGILGKRTRVWPRALVVLGPLGAIWAQ